MSSCSETALSNFHKISHGAFCQKGIANLFKWFRIIEQDGCHAHKWWKHLKIFSKTKNAWGWILVYSIEDSRSTKFVQMMTASWPLTFLRQG